MNKKFEVNQQGKNLIIETGALAKQAHGAVTVQLGGTVVLVSACASKKAKEGMDFFPLFVEYQERTYAAGKIPGGFFKREGRPSEKAILTSRLIDRPIRPLFPEGMANEVQIMAMVLSSDGENDSDILGIIGASAALSISDIPFDGPIAACRVGLVDGKFILNPTFQELLISDLDMVVAGKTDKILMMEAGAKEVDETVVAEAIEFARKSFKDVVELQNKMVKECGKATREDITYNKISEELIANLKSDCKDKLSKILLMDSKEERVEVFSLICDEMVEKYCPDENSECKPGDVISALNIIEKTMIREYMLSEEKRVDKRGLREIRALSCEIGVLPRTHGSAVFTRGQTQSLSVTTLGTAADEQRIDALEGETTKGFMLHYNFPPFSVGEVKPIRGTGRREIGHGALAERALKSVMPSKDDFPYTVRVVSDILESNGSSSMATVCAGTLALMDAGVPIKSPVAGIALGLVSDGKKSLILTDIAGVEDHFGDMDFKVAGTKEGITAIQLDMKISGFGLDTIKLALDQAKEARLEILDVMEKAISSPKETVSQFAPKIVTFKIKTDKIKDVIGPGGKIIKQIIQDTGVTINIDDDGTVQVGAVDEEAQRKAVEIIEGIVAEAKVGKIYNGKITRIMNFGAFCEILPGKEGLIHVSELADKFVKNVTDVVNVGDKVTVKVIEIDDQRRVNLSIKQALEKTEEKAS